MAKTTDTTDNPQGETIPTEPMRCICCGNLLGYYSDGSDANLRLHCWKCSNDYDVTLREGASNYKRRGKIPTNYPREL